MIAPRRAPRSRVLKIRPRPLRRARGIPRRGQRDDAGWRPVGLRWRRLLAAGAPRAGRMTPVRGAAIVARPAARRHAAAHAPRNRPAGMLDPRRARSAASGRMVPMRASAALPRVQGAQAYAVPSATMLRRAVAGGHVLAVQRPALAGPVLARARGATSAVRHAPGRALPSPPARAAPRAGGAVAAPVPHAAERRPAPADRRLRRTGAVQDTNRPAHDAGMARARGSMAGLAAGAQRSPARAAPAGTVRRAPLCLRPARVGRAPRTHLPSPSPRARPAAAADTRAGLPVATAWARPMPPSPGGGAGAATGAATLALRTDMAWRATAPDPGQPAGGATSGAPAHAVTGPAGALPGLPAPGAAAPSLAQPGRAPAGAPLDPALVERLVDDVLRRAEQRLRTDRERRGL
jgi:hypothetical protein